MDTTAGVIRSARPEDAAAICEIYNHYVLHTVATFELRAVLPTTMAGRVRAVLARGLPWLVLVDSGAVTGYAYAAPWKEREAYRRSAESTVYISPHDTGHGVGGRLYSALIESLRDGGVHSVLGGIALPNPASIALHERLGFHKVAHLSQVGWKQGRWVDVGYWQLVFNG